MIDIWTVLQGLQQEQLDSDKRAEDAIRRAVPFQKSLNPQLEQAYEGQGLVRDPIDPLDIMLLGGGIGWGRIGAKKVANTMSDSLQQMIDSRLAGAVATRSGNALKTTVDDIFPSVIKNKQAREYFQKKLIDSYDESTSLAESLRKFGR